MSQQLITGLRLALTSHKPDLNEAASSAADACAWG